MVAVVPTIIRTSRNMVGDFEERKSRIVET